MVSITQHELEACSRHINFFVDKLKSSKTNFNQDDLKALDFLGGTSDRLSLIIEALFKLAAFFLNEEVDSKKELVSLEELALSLRDSLSLDFKNKKLQVQLESFVDLKVPHFFMEIFLKEIFLNSLKYSENELVKIILENQVTDDGFLNLLVSEDAKNSKVLNKAALRLFISGGGTNDGAGLGLFLCKLVAQKYGGDLEIVEGERLCLKASFKISNF